MRPVRRPVRSNARRPFRPEPLCLLRESKASLRAPLTLTPAASSRTTKPIKTIDSNKGMETTKGIRTKNNNITIETTKQIGTIEITARDEEQIRTTRAEIRPSEG